MQEAVLKMEKKHASDIEMLLHQGYKKRPLKIISCVHLAIGIIAIIAEITRMSASSNHEGETILSLGEGFYCGVIFLLTGLVGFLTISATSSCKVKAFLVLSIFCSICGGWLLAVSGCIILGPITYGHALAILIHAVLIVCGLTELVLGIVSSSYSCKTCCACCKSDAEDVGGKSVLYLADAKDVDAAKPGVDGLTVKDTNSFQTGISDQKNSKIDVEQMVSKIKGYARFP